MIICSKPLNLVLFNVSKSLLIFVLFCFFKREFQVCLQKYYFSLRSWPLEGHPILSLLTHLSLCLSKNIQGRAALSTTWSTCCFVCSTELPRCQTGWLLPTASTGWILRGLLSRNHLDLITNPFLLPKDQKSAGQLSPFPLYSDTFTFISKFTPQRSKVPSLRACWEKKVGRLWSVLNVKEFGLDPVTPQRALQGSEVTKLDFRNN